MPPSTYETLREGSVSQTPLSEALQAAHDAERISGALHNIGSGLNADEARIQWSKCAFGFRAARCDVRKGNDADAIREIAQTRDGLAALLALVKKAQPEGSIWQESGERVLDAINEKLSAVQVQTDRSA